MALKIKADVQHIAVLNLVVLTLFTQFTRLFSGSLSAQRVKVGVGDGFGPDKAALKVAVDDASGFGRSGPRCAASRPALPWGRR